MNALYEHLVRRKFHLRGLSCFHNTFIIGECKSKSSLHEIPKVSCDKGVLYKLALDIQNKGTFSKNMDESCLIRLLKSWMVWQTAFFKKTNVSYANNGLKNYRFQRHRWHRSFDCDWTYYVRIVMKHSLNTEQIRLSQSAVCDGQTYGVICDNPRSWLGRGYFSLFRVEISN